MFSHFLYGKHCSKNIYSSQYPKIGVSIYESGSCRGIHKFVIPQSLNKFPCWQDIHAVNMSRFRLPTDDYAMVKASFFRNRLQISQIMPINAICAFHLYGGISNDKIHLYASRCPPIRNLSITNPSVKIASQLMMHPRFEKMPVVWRSRTCLAPARETAGNTGIEEIEL